MRRLSAVQLLNLLVFLIPIGLILLLIVWFFSNPSDLSAVDQLSSVTQVALQIILFSAAIGASAMAVMEAAKKLLAIRGRFHYQQFEQLLGHAGKRAVLLTTKPQSKEKYTPLNSVLIETSDGQYTKSVVFTRFDVPLEQLIAQVGNVAEKSLNRLENEQHSGGFEAKLLSAIAGQPGRKVLAELDREEKDSPPIDELRAELLAELRALVDIGLDDLQVMIGNRWRRLIRLQVCAIAALIALVPVTYARTGPAVKTAALVIAFVLGGFFAWLFRDLVAIAERRRI